MKNYKILIVASMLFGIGTTMLAQSTYTDKANNEYQFKKHAFLNLQGGAQYTLGEAKFDKLLSPNVQLGLGYQFSPVFALRLQANGWQSKGGWNGYELARTGNPYTADYKFNYVAPGLDLMFNLSNLFCGWNPNRVFNVTAFLGGGANIAWKNDEVNAIAKTLKNLDNYQLQNLWDGTKVQPYGRGGVELAFRLSDAVSFLVEGNANILSDKYNSKKADNPDWYFNALAGFRINLGKTYKKVEAPAPEPAPVQEYVEPTPAPTPAPEVKKEVVEKKVEPFRRDVFFLINSAKIRNSEAGKIQEMVDYLNANPNAKVSVTGYADAGTGNNRINDRLARLRAQIVVKTLKEKYNIPADRIISDSKGSRVQPFAVNNKNRVTICIAE
ncbi:OmpA family protein [Hoylesella timonensis]|uniref:OmpA family protein n=1 Tax=Hoylesella timonensis TaxID=386414 RepID=UPI00242BB419|nr:OmpA family protein [Hoylesella timonensis]